MVISNLGFGLAALLVATSVTILGIVTTKYPRTYFLLTPRKCLWLYVYGLIYGVIALGIVGSDVFHLKALGFSNPWLQAIAVGVSVKSFLDIRVFSIPTSNELTESNQEPNSVPIGLETLVQIFEPWLLRAIRTDEFNAREEFLAPYLLKYTDPNEVHKRIKLGIPRNWTKVEREVLELNLEASAKATDDPSEKVKHAMDSYLRAMGKRSFERVFPLS